MINIHRFFPKRPFTDGCTDKRSIVILGEGEAFANRERGLSLCWHLTLAFYLHQLPAIILLGEWKTGDHAGIGGAGLLPEVTTTYRSPYTTETYRPGILYDPNAFIHQPTQRHFDSQSILYI